MIDSLSTIELHRGPQMMMVTRIAIADTDEAGCLHRIQVRIRKSQIVFRGEWYHLSLCLICGMGEPQRLCSSYHRLTALGLCCACSPRSLCSLLFA